MSNAPRRFNQHTSRIAALAFAGVFVVCAVVMGIVFVMNNNNNDPVDANVTVSNSVMVGHSFRTVTSNTIWPNGNTLTATIDMVIGGWTFGVVNLQNNTMQQVPNLSVTRTTAPATGQYVTLNSGSINFNYLAAFPPGHRMYRTTGTAWSFGGARPTTGLTFIGNTAAAGTTNIMSGSAVSNGTCNVAPHGYNCNGSMSGSAHMTGFASIGSGSAGIGHGLVTVTVPAQSVILVPITHTVTFNSHGGTAVPTQNILQDMPAIQPNPNPTLANHTFRHWSATQNGATPWNFATLITGPTTINATNTLHAVWWVNPIITFNAQGGSPTPPQQRPAHGGVIVQPASPTLLNHTFRHWSETPGGATAWNFATTTTIDRTLHAVWWVNPTVNFLTHGGSTPPPNQRPAHGGAIIEPQPPTRSGFNFRHWSATQNGTVPWNFNHTITTNQTLHAVWDVMIWRQVHFRIGNPLNNTAVTFIHRIEYLTTMYLESFIPAEQDLIFLGWATSAENARNKVIAHQPHATMHINFAGTRTLYAVWDINWDHFPGLDGHNTMSLNFTGGINPDQSGGIVRIERQFWSWDPLSRWLPSTEYMHAWEAEREPSPQNRRTFLGWFDNSAGTGTPWTSIPSTHSGPIEFWAIWTV